MNEQCTLQTGPDAGPYTRWPDGRRRIPCHQDRATITGRACHINQAAALGVLRDIDRGTSPKSIDDWRLKRFISCGRCERCGMVSPGDVERVAGMVRALWDRFGRLPLEYTDAEVMERNRKARERRKYINKRKRMGKGAYDGQDDITA
jgi:hypothetical protein